MPYFFATSVSDIPARRSPKWPALPAFSEWNRFAAARNAAEIGASAAPSGIHLEIVKNDKKPPICAFLAVYSKLPKLGT